MNEYGAPPPPTPAEILGWLRSLGAVETDRSARWTTIRWEVDGQPVVLDVPLLVGARDYAQAVQTLIADISEVQRRNPQAVLADVRSACLDVIRLTLRGPGMENGSLGVGAGVGTLQGARDLLLAAACSAIEPRSAYLGRKPVQALDFLELAKFARVERGSVVLCIEVPVPPLLQGAVPHTDAEMPEPELARRVTRQLVTGMVALQDALPDCSAADSIEPAVSRVTTGVSANLCDAIMRMLEAARAEELGMSVGFASRRQVPVSLPRKATFRASDMAMLREVARGLQARNEAQFVTVLGPVVRLHSLSPATGGSATLQVDLEGRVRLVRLDLDAKNYNVALEAHKAFQFVAVQGILHTQPSGLTLTPTGPLSVREIQESA